MYVSNVVLYFNIFQKCFLWGMSTLEEENETIHHPSNNYRLPRL